MKTQFFRCMAELGMAIMKTSRYCCIQEHRRNNCCIQSKLQSQYRSHIQLYYLRVDYVCRAFIDQQFPQP